MSRARFHTLQPADPPLVRIARYPPALDVFGRDRLYRFNDPRERFGVLYAAATFECAVLECWGEPGQKLIDWRLGVLPAVGLVRARSRLELLDLHGTHAALVGADARLCVGDDYETTQAWSRAVYETGAADGLWYPARKGGFAAAALFDSSARKVRVEPAGDVLDAHWAPQLLAIAAKYDYAVAPLSYDPAALARVLGS